VAPENRIVNELYVFIYEDADGDETVVIAPTSHGNIPMITTTSEMKDRMKPLAQQVADVTHRTVKILKFTDRQELLGEEIEERLVKPVSRMPDNL